MFKRKFFLWIAVLLAVSFSAAACNDIEEGEQPTEEATSEANDEITQETTQSAEVTGEATIEPTQEMTAEATTEATSEGTSEAAAEGTDEMEGTAEGTVGPGGTLPAACQNEEAVTIADWLANHGGFTTFVAMLEAANLFQTLDQDGSYTVFAPTDEAFESRGQEQVDAWMNNIDALTVLLLGLIVPESGTDSDVQGDHTTLSGGTLALEGNAEITESSEELCNGVVHGIDQVMEVAPGTANSTPTP